MSNAYFVAKQQNFSFRCFWGWCGEKSKQIEVYNYLFRPCTREEIVPFVSSRHQRLPFYNDVNGFYSLTRVGNRQPDQKETQQQNHSSSSCPCQQSKIESDLELYTSLRERFRQRSVVDNFVANYFKNKFVIGIHVRAGNGETGDFVNKGRGISNPEIWVKHVCHLIRDYIQEHLSSVGRQQSDIALYIATDTPSMIPMFRKRLEEQKLHYASIKNTNITIPIYDLPQSQRPQEGQGVLFGEAIAVTNKNENNNNNETDIDDYSDCLQGWIDTLTDMFILSHANVVIAGKPSSFSQTLPMSLAFGRERATTTRRLPPVYCEVIPHHEKVIENNTPTSAAWIEIEPTMQCYTSYEEWCCDYSTWIQFRHVGPKGHTRIVSKEFIQFPKPEITNPTEQQQAKLLKAMRIRPPNCLRPKRGRAGGGRKDKCLPHEW